MPLHAHHPSPVRELERLDEIIDDRCRDEPSPKRFFGHSLVMPRVDRERSPARRHCETRPRSDRHVAVLDEALALLWPMSRHILDEASIAHDVQDLKSAADAEYGKVARDRGPRHIDLERITVGVNVSARDIERTVPRWLDVATTRDADAVDVAWHRVARMQDDEIGACGLERVAIPLVRGLLERRGSRQRERDPRTHSCHGMESRRLARSMSSIRTPPDARGWMKATIPSAPRRGA